MKKTVLIGMLLTAALMAGGCGAETSAEVTPAAETISVTVAVSEDTQYGAALAEISPEEMEEAGFLPGDACDVVFSNGYEIDDVPYYTGYYVAYGEPVMVAYPGNDMIRITYNNAGIWETAGLAEGDEVTITLAAAGANAALQEALEQSYSYDRADYGSDVEFCNFRALTGGSLRADFLFRGTSPVDNSCGRAAYTDDLLEAQGIGFVLDLADTEESIACDLAEEGFDSPYAASLYADGKIALCGLTAAFRSEAFHQNLAAGLREMLDAEGPVYIHCLEGKDRTGFVCMLLEALAGASYDEMRADYMVTYGNYYGVTSEGTPEKYDAIAALYFDEFALYLHGTDDRDELAGADFTGDAAAYLLAAGMTEDEIARLTAFLTGE